MQENCDRCKRPLTEIDYYGEWLVGCIECNLWRSDQREIKLSEEELMVLNEIDRQVAMVAQFHLAKRRVESMQTYLASGRRFQGLSNEQLQKRYVQIMQQWASAPAEPGSRRLAEDVHSEYEVRNLLPPQNLVLAELKSIGLTVARLYEELPEDRKDEIGAEIFEDYERAQKDRH
jgi:hypothetical protein